MYNNENESQTHKKSVFFWLPVPFPVCGLDQIDILTLLKQGGIEDPMY